MVDDGVLDTADDTSDDWNDRATQHPKDGKLQRRRWRPQHGEEGADDIGAVEKGLGNQMHDDDDGNDDKKWQSRRRCLFFGCEVVDPSSFCRQRRWGLIVVVVSVALVVLLTIIHVLAFVASQSSSSSPSTILFRWSVPPPPLPNTVHNPSNIIVGGNSMTNPLARNEQQHHQGLPIPVRHSTATTTTLRILYVHIGKTGGELVKAQLGPALCKTRKNKLLKEACLKRFRMGGSDGGGDRSGKSNRRTTVTKDDALSPSSHISTPTTYVYTSLLSQRTIGYMHVHNPIVPKNALQVATHYLYSIRHPLSRLVSWYVYNHPKSCDMREPNSPSCKSASAVAAAKATTSSPTRDDDVIWTVEFYRCFPTVAEWVNKVVVVGMENGSNNNNKYDDDDRRCVTLFWDGWNGRVNNLKHPNHLYWNYEFYWNQTLARTPHRRILIVRQESLVQDLQGLEEYLHTVHTVGGRDSGGDTETPHDGVPTNGVSPSDSTTRLVLIPADSEHYVSGRVSSNLDGPDSSSRMDRPTAMRKRRMVCCALFRVEWPIYMTLIQRAENLNLDEKRRSLHEAWTHCGVVGDATTDGADGVVQDRDHRTEADMLLHYTIPDWKETFEALACA